MSMYNSYNSYGRYSQAFTGVHQSLHKSNRQHLERCSVGNLVYVFSSYYSEGTTETNKYIKRTLVSIESGVCLICGLIEWICLY